ncbi:hypothetical protein Syun_001058 [Stephania yunnanensis]|uniref:Uncharacterized protein n=1 Tax=Stephania yunnanensis TaxID=152371 RepID=A0AAP0LE65_9MAGN
MVDNGCKVVGEIKWEVRPRGMLVQKREDFDQSSGEIILKVRVSTGSQWHGISIEATPTFLNNDPSYFVVTCVSMPWVYVGHQEDRVMGQLGTPTGEILGWEFEVMGQLGAPTRGILGRIYGILGRVSELDLGVSKVYGLLERKVGLLIRNTGLTPWIPQELISIFQSPINLENSLHVSLGDPLGTITLKLPHGQYFSGAEVARHFILVSASHEQ